MWYRYRRGPRGMRYFWFLFIPLFFIGGSHGFLGIFLWIVMIILFSLLGRAIFAAISSSSTTQNTWYQQSNQQPYYRPDQYQQSNQQPYYQPSQYQQQPYTPYQQGYQQPYYQPRTNEETQATQQQYDSYEQPRAEYPQEMPPMQQ